MPRLPERDGEGSFQAWGGKNPIQWKPEAVLANATSKALNEGWSRSGIKDVLVAVPVQMYFSKPSDNWMARPYDDGQTNAGVSFPGWTEKEPPLVGSLLRFSRGSDVLALRFSGKLGGRMERAEIVYFIEKPEGSGKFEKRQAEVALEMQSGARLGEWKVDSQKKWGDLVVSRPLFVRPVGWEDWFVLDFRHVVVGLKDLAAAVRGKSASQNRPLLDPEKIGPTSHAGTPFKRLLQRSKDRSFGPGINTDPYEPTDIHGRLPVGPQVITTSVGKGWTWVLSKGPDAPFKNLYTCFERRNPVAEAREGVPSGGGWHEIGDAAETIINNLEDAPLVVGSATGLPWPAPPTGAFAYQLGDIVVVRWLRPGEALVTPAGETTWKEDEPWRRINADGSQNKDSSFRGRGGPSGRNYHWFYFQSDREVCTQEWVHDCVPNVKNSLGTQCP